MVKSIRLAGWGFCLMAANAFAFDSGSTGADGALTPNVDTVVTLPASGVLNYSEINIPAGVRVSFQGNASNTPVTVLVSGDALIAGILDLNGKDAPDSNGAGDGNVADDGLPGRGGPGGYAGGRGGAADASTAANSLRIAAAGIGPGGGRPATKRFDSYCGYAPGGSFATAGSADYASQCGYIVAPTYGNADLLPLIGGSGGAGGHGGTGIGGAGGGGGGGALLLAVSGTLNVTGQILANGGRGGRVGGPTDTSLGAVGGGGSGGGLRLVATTLAGNGSISAIGGNDGAFNNGTSNSQSGGNGRIRLEADFLQRTATTTPTYTTSAPRALVVAGLPSLRIASVGGISAPTEPTGYADIVLATDAPNPAQLVIETHNIPLGNTASIIVNPPGGTPVTVVSSAIVGSEANGTATANVDIPNGASVLLATLSYAVSGAQAQALSALTEGEPVVAVELAAQLGDSASGMTLITDSGRRVSWPAGMP